MGKAYERETSKGNADSKQQFVRNKPDWKADDIK